MPKHTIFDKCDAGDHCYKLVKENKKDMNNKGKCPECGSVLFATERRPNGDSICSKCNFSGKTTEFYKFDKEPEKPKMKFNELNFKVITTTYERNTKLMSIFDKINRQPKDKDAFKKALFMRIFENDVTYWNNCDYSCFDSLESREVTFEEAVKLIESCEPLAKKTSGKFIEYDIDENGDYNLENGGKINWQEHLAFEIAKGCIFGGWFWVNPDNAAENGWSIDRLGFDSRTKIMNPACEHWEYPLIPTKIRFWVKD